MRLLWTVGGGLGAKRGGAAMMESVCVFGVPWGGGERTRSYTLETLFLKTEWQAPVDQVAVRTRFHN